jgi:hypothetical protein
VVRIDVSDRALVEELLEFLRRCSCTVDLVGPTSIRVTLDLTVSVGAALSLVRAGICYACAGAIEAPLARLGSALCLDCRGSEGAREDGAARREWARMEVEAYLRVWQARHPAAKAVLSDLGPAAIAAAAR